MFGKNEIVGRKHFDGEERLLVTSYFLTLQGEGPYSGLPAVFVRLAKCNLACSFCDTYFDSGDWMTETELDRSINDLLWEYGHSAQDLVLVITGGEPLLQKNLSTWLDGQVGEWKAIQIETNGTVHQELHPGITVVLSPKCREKGGKAVSYLRPHRKTLESASCLKFVMEAKPDSPYASIPNWALDWKNDTGKEIYVSPMNVYNREPKRAKVARNSNEPTIEQRSRVEEVISFWEPGLLNLESNERNHRHAAEYALERGLRFQVQAHLYAGMA